jgi:hypothetical protein
VAVTTTLNGLPALAVKPSVPEIRPEVGLMLRPVVYLSGD